MRRDRDDDEDDDDEDDDDDDDDDFDQQYNDKGETTRRRDGTHTKTHTHQDTRATSSSCQHANQDNGQWTLETTTIRQVPRINYNRTKKQSRESCDMQPIIKTTVAKRHRHRAE